MDCMNSMISWVIRDDYSIRSPNKAFHIEAELTAIKKWPNGKSYKWSVTFP